MYIYTHMYIYIHIFTQSYIQKHTTTLGSSGVLADPALPAPVLRPGDLVRRRREGPPPQTEAAGFQQDHPSGLSRALNSGASVLGPEELPILGFQIPKIAIVSDTSKYLEVIWVFIQAYVLRQGSVWMVVLSWIVEWRPRGLAVCLAGAALKFELGCLETLG